MYGIQIADEGDEYVGMVEEALDGVAQGGVQGKFLVEYLPFLRHIPPWVPGASAQRLFKKWQAAGDRAKNVPFDHGRAQISAVRPFLVDYGDYTGKLTARIGSCHRARIRTDSSVL